MMAATRLPKLITSNGHIELTDHNGRLELVFVGSDGDYAALTPTQAWDLACALTDWLVDDGEVNKVFEDDGET